MRKTRGRAKQTGGERETRGRAKQTGGEDEMRGRAKQTGDERRCRDRSKARPGGRTRTCVVVRVVGLGGALAVRVVALDCKAGREVHSAGRGPCKRAGAGPRSGAPGGRDGGHREREVLVVVVGVVCLK